MLHRDAARLETASCVKVKRERESGSRAGGQSGEDTNQILLIWNAITMFCNSFSYNISCNYNQGAKQSRRYFDVSSICKS